MSRILVEELKDSLEQKFKFTLHKRYVVGAICPYIFMMGAPAGTFTFKVINEDGVTVWSKPFTSNDLKASLGTIADDLRVYYPLIADPFLLIGSGVYTFKLESTGYQYNRSSFIGWIKEHESTPIGMSYVPTNDGEKPLSVKIKIFKEASI